STRWAAATAQGSADRSPGGRGVLVYPGRIPSSWEASHRNRKGDGPVASYGPRRRYREADLLSHQRCRRRWPVLSAGPQSPVAVGLDRPVARRGRQPRPPSALSLPWPILLFFG